MNKPTHGEASFSEWSVYHDKAPIALYPTESIVRILCGRFIPGLREKLGRDGFKDVEALEVGFGSGMNLSLLGRLGMQLSGAEVATKIVEKGRANLLGWGYEADLRVGSNLNLPFDDDKFDIVLTWQAIHYVNNSQEMKAAIAEHARVLKPGGRIIAGTTGPRHRMRENAVPLGNGLYQTVHSMDHTGGQIFFYFNSKRQIKNHFSKRFENILVGRTVEDLFTGINDYFLITATKPII